MPRLSKSQFIRGLQCYKSLWLYRNKPKLRTPPDAAQQAIFDSGTNVGILAQQLFPGGQELVFGFKKIYANIQKTRELIKSGIDTIYEATFIHDNVLVMVDILHKGENGWEMYEVKSSTSVKAVYENDVSVQYYVLRGNDLKISKAAVVFINNQYVRQGELDVHQLFTIEDITDTVISRQPFVTKELINLQNMLQGDEPNIDIGPYCSDPYPCDFLGYCWQHIPDYSVFNLTNLYLDKKFELYNNGILKFKDIPVDYSLSHAQQLQVDADLTGKEFIDKNNIQSFLSNISSPLGFLDFETFMQAVPSFDEQRPYQQIPFQYSLHVQNDGDLDHYEFLAEPGRDPREELVDRLIKDTEGCKTILVYNQGFEKRILKELAGFFPDKAEALNSIIDRIVDLMKPFQAKYWYTKDMIGKHSIKYVLPALVKGCGYEQLNISDGGMAMSAYAQLQELEDAKVVEKIKTDLLKYCEMDTMAMVKILEKLKNI